MAARELDGQRNHPLEKFGSMVSVVECSGFRGYPAEGTSCAAPFEKIGDSYLPDLPG